MSADNQQERLDSYISGFVDGDGSFHPKQKDFEKFAYIVKVMNDGFHLNKDNFIKLLKIAFTMNRNGSYRKKKIEEIIKDLESSTTIH